MNKGAMGFDKKYWDVNYSQPDEMDGIGNVDAHIRYIKSMFDVEQIRLLSVADLGFGLGYFLEKYIKMMKPTKVVAIEPSEFAYNIGLKKVKSLCNEKGIKIYEKKIDLLSWIKNYDSKSGEVIDLGICTSVFQYLSEEEIESVVPLLHKHFRYLYFSVPTKIELERQVSEVEFNDSYAYRRSKSFYYKLLSKNFTFISQRLLESKKFYNHKNTPFTDLLFRF